MLSNLKEKDTCYKLFLQINLIISALNNYHNYPITVSMECSIGNGLNYVGTLNVTRQERTCQRWDRQYPHQHRQITKISLRYPGHTTLSSVENYCRNPDYDRKAWCYTTDPLKRFQFCDIPTCAGNATMSLLRMNCVNVKLQYRAKKSICPNMWNA